MNTFVCNKILKDKLCATLVYNYVLTNGTCQKYFNQKGKMVEVTLVR